MYFFPPHQKYQFILFGFRSHSEYTILTHFSQRFPKLSESMLVDASNFVYGSDMLTFTKSQLPQLIKVAPAITSVLCSSEEESEESSKKGGNEEKSEGGKKSKKERQRKTKNEEGKN